MEVMIKINNTSRKKCPPINAEERTKNLNHV